jgi:5,5'-dehydrodivanillate O-demethylase
MSEDFTLYRGEGGRPHVVGFRCPHRLTQLSVGWVEEDCIRCRFHGWKFDSSGQCVEQPAEKESFAEKVRIRSCPTEEYLGLVFAYFVKATRRSPRYPDFAKMASGGLCTAPTSSTIWKRSIHIPFTTGIRLT